MKRILLATDFSTRSDRALRRAALIAKAIGATLQVVHVVDADLPERFIDADISRAKTTLDQLVASIGSVEAIEARDLIVVDDIHNGILKIAEEIQADLIIIGPHRRRLRDIFVGTTAERLLQRSTIPLLIAIAPPVRDYRKALLALHFNESSKAAGQSALHIGLFDHAEVVVMHAFDAPAEGHLKRSFATDDEVADYVLRERGRASSELGTMVKELGLPPTSLMIESSDGAPSRTILDAAKEIEADLIVVGSTRRKGIERTLVGSVTADVIRNSNGDILVLP